jgi:hypothetical protein
MRMWDVFSQAREVLVWLKAFGPNRSRLALLKYSLDPGNVLAYACPLTTNPIRPKVIVLVTRESCAGKDHCADIWCSLFISVSHRSLRAQTLSISDVIKQAYAAATGADLKRLLWDRAYKELHLPTLTKCFENKVRQRPQWLEEQLWQVLENGADVDVLLITGTRDEAPVASYSHLVPDSHGRGGKVWLMHRLRIEAKICVQWLLIGAEPQQKGFQEFNYYQCRIHLIVPQPVIVQSHASSDMALYAGMYSACLTFYIEYGVDD